MLDVKLNSSPRPELSPRPVYSSLIPGVPNPKVSLECPRVPNPRVSPKCPAPESPLECQPQSVAGVPSPRVPTHNLSKYPKCPQSAQPGVRKLNSLSLECPTPECPRSAQPRNVPGVPNPRVSLPREGGDVRSKVILRVRTLCFMQAGGLFNCHPYT